MKKNVFHKRIVSADTTRRIREIIDCSQKKDEPVKANPESFHLNFNNMDNNNEDTAIVDVNDLQITMENSRDNSPTTITTSNIVSNSNRIKLVRGKSGNNKYKIYCL